MGEWTAKAFTPGITVRLTMANGARALSTVMESGRATTATHTWASGTRIKRTGTVFMNGQTETSMKANGITVCDMERAQIGFTQAIVTREITTTAESTARVSTAGQTATITKASSKTT